MKRLLVVVVVFITLLPSLAWADFGKILGSADAEYAEDLVVVGHFGYVTGKTKGLHIIDVSDPTSPSPVSTYDTKGEAWDLAYGLDHIFLANKGGGLKILDISDPVKPKEVATYAPGWNVIAVDIDEAGKKVYIAGGDGSNGILEVLDVADIAAPKMLGSAKVTGRNSAAASLGHKDNYVYYGQSEGTLRIYDVSDPKSPKEAGSFRNEGRPGHEPWCLGITVHNDLLFLADWGAGTLILDISSPTAPKELFVFNEGNYAYYDSFATDTRLYTVADGGLAVLDITDPSNPTLIGGKLLSLKVRMDDGPHGIWVIGNNAYAADNKEKRLTIVDIGE